MIGHIICAVAGLCFGRGIGKANIILIILGLVLLAIGLAVPL